MRSIKNRVGVWQVATGKSKESFGELIGMSKTTLYAKLNGESEFTLSEARRIAGVLGCSVDQLFEDPVVLKGFTTGI